MKKGHFMLAIQGIYDGKKIIPLEKLPKEKPYKVIITFVEELGETEEIRNFSSQADSFEFWSSSKEDIYQDYIPKES